MDIKKEDKSEQSKKDHIVYYKSLNKTISELQEERNGESDATIQRYMDVRIDAIEQDRKRIRKMFPDVSEEEWN
ncbi:MAG: hypothetical protein ABGW47_03650 [Nitrosopumilus sp.]|jgi:uncharacterized protein YicC (UPF0701 family)